MAENVQISLGVKSDTKQAEKNVESLKRALSSLQAVAARVGEGDSITKYAVQVKSAANTIKSVVNQSNIGKAMDKFADTPSLKNLDNVAENTQAAESQIRDTDMAEEMVRYSNNNILAQAGQSMLAQANQTNQGVLSLLQ